MQIRFVQNAEIRSNSNDLTDQSLMGEVFERKEMEVEDMMYPGATIAGNDNWFKDANGWFYWSGFAVAIMPERPGSSIPGIDDIPLNGIPGEITPVVGPPEMPAVIAVLQEPDEPVYDAAGELMPQGETRLPQDDTIDEAMTGTIDLPADVLQERDAPLVPLFASPSPQQKIFADEQLNWGIRLLDIQQQYWMKKQSTGKGVRIALLGTGVAANCKDIQISDAFVFPGLGEDITDLDGMGTQAAVVATGRGLYRCGVAPDASLLVGKIGALHHTVTPKALLDGLDWAIASEADIVVVLTHFARLDPDMEDQIRQKIVLAVSRNIAIIAPAGHASDNYSTGLQYPGAFPGVLSVGSCNEQGQRSSFSAKNGKIDLLAPGEALEVVSYDGNTVVPNTPDTAIAASFAAGCMALIIQDFKNGNKPFSVLKIMDNLKSQAFNKQKYGVNAVDTGTGYGLLRLPD